MEIEGIVNRLEAWRRRHDAMMTQYEALYKLTGAMPDSALWTPIFDLWSAYTRSLAEIVGDNGEWLQWYELECDMGAKPKMVKSDTGVEIKVKTLRQLARVITW